MRLCKNEYTTGKKVYSFCSMRIQTYKTISCVLLYRQSTELLRRRKFNKALGKIYFLS
jgi:hypothetical protein